MKIEQAYQQITEQTLEEGRLKQAAMATALAGASLLMTQQAHKEPPKPTFDPQHSITNISTRYNIDEDKAKKIVDIAQKYSKHPFPQAHHILGTIGVESSFNEKAKSKLKFDPAVGLMQIRPKVTGTHPSELKDIEGQIKHGSDMLHTLYKKTGDEDKAIQAYNIGLTAYNKGKRAVNYLEKTKKETAQHLVNPDQD